MDSPESCVNLDHFKSYPFDITYHYNSRGFRDQEWPDELSNAIWCLGDSFTVGLGSALSHTWVNLLQAKTQIRCINISLDGASNQWISRRAIQILKEIQPKYLVIHWSYLHRSEDDDSSISDEDRRVHINTKALLPSEQIKIFLHHFHEVEKVKGKTKIIYSHIPNGHPFPVLKEVECFWNDLKGDQWPSLPTNWAEFRNLPKFVKQELESVSSYVFARLKDFVAVCELPERNQYENYLSKDTVIPYLKQLDFARDGHHYDIKTADLLTNQIISLL